MPHDEPTDRQRLMAIALFSLIIIAGLAAAVFLLQDAQEEVEEADEPGLEEAPGEEGTGYNLSQPEAAPVATIELTFSDDIVPGQAASHVSLAARNS